MTSHENSVPKFGERVPGVHYLDRPGSYGLAFDAGTNRVCLMRTNIGYFIPGGGSEAGETEKETLVREVGEECGRSVEVIRKIGVAVEHVFAEGEGHFAKVCAFYEVRLGETISDHSEDDHALAWIPIEEARELITHQSQQWALEAALQGR